MGLPSPLILLTLLSIWTLHLVQGKKCPGMCLDNVEICRKNGGKVLGYCTNQMPCCDNFKLNHNSSIQNGHCGDTIIGVKTVNFMSPNYPEHSTGELTCTFDFSLSPDTVAIKIEFLNVTMDGLNHAGTRCDSDLFFFKGFKTWTPPPFCDDLQGYAILIQREPTEGPKMEQLRMVALMSSERYRWQIKLTQISHTESINLPKKSSPAIEVKQREKTSLETPMILNGEETDVSQVPWQASIRVNLFTIPATEATTKTPSNKTQTVTEDPCDPDEGHILCGGSILDERHILSAAHCFYGSSKSMRMQGVDQLKIVVGDTDKCKNSSVGHDLLHGQQEYEVEMVTLHYAYDKGMYLNDVAVVKLKTAIQFTKNVQPIPLAHVHETFYGRQATCSGWGTTNFSSAVTTPKNLMASSNFLVRSQEECFHEIATFYHAPSSFKSHPKYAHASHAYLCTTTINNTHGHVSTGKVDSGGPLVSKILNENGSQTSILIGIVSFYFPPATKKYEGQVIDVFSSVAHYRPWIDLALVA